MSPSETIHAFIPIFNWGWWQVFAFVFITDWVIIRLLKRYEPASLKRPDRWLSAKYGDLILPFGIASSVFILHGFHNSRVWYATRGWNWVVLITGIAVNLTLDLAILNRTLHKYTNRQELAPSHLWHSLIFFILFYIAGMSILPILSLHTPLWAVFLAMFGYGGWLVTLLYDLTHPSGFVRRRVSLKQY